MHLPSEPEERPLAEGPLDGLVADVYEDVTVVQLGERGNSRCSQYSRKHGDKYAERLDESRRTHG